MKIEEHQGLRVILSERLFLSIRSTICETSEGLETGVTLFGIRQAMSRVALFAVGPGPHAVHTPGFHEPDTKFVNEEVEQLRATRPSLEWIGSLHVHPFGMPWLSGHDRHTVSDLFLNYADLVPDFIAGIIQRHGPCLLIYPYALSRELPEPRLSALDIVPDESAVISDALKLSERPAEPVLRLTTGEQTKCLEARNKRCRVSSAIRRFTRRVRRLVAVSSPLLRKGSTQ